MIISWKGYKIVHTIFGLIQSSTLHFHSWSCGKTIGYSNPLGSLRLDIIFTVSHDEVALVPELVADVDLMLVRQHPVLQEGDGAAGVEPLESVELRLGQVRGVVERGVEQRDVLRAGGLALELETKVCEDFTY